MLTIKYLLGSTVGVSGRGMESQDKAGGALTTLSLQDIIAVGPHAPVIEPYTKDKCRGETRPRGERRRRYCTEGRDCTPVASAACCQYSNEQFSQLIEAELIAIDFRLAIQSAQSSLVHCVCVWVCVFA